jgi:hypothetical protein
MFSSLSNVLQRENECLCCASHLLCSRSLVQKISLWLHGPEHAHFALLLLTFFFVPKRRSSSTQLSTTNSCDWLGLYALPHIITTTISPRVKAHLSLSPWYAHRTRCRQTKTCTRYWVFRRQLRKRTSRTHTVRSLAHTTQTNMDPEQPKRCNRSITHTRSYPTPSLAKSTTKLVLIPPFADPKTNSLSVLALTLVLDTAPLATTTLVLASPSSQKARRDHQAHIRRLHAGTATKMLPARNTSSYPAVAVLGAPSAPTAHSHRSPTRQKRPSIQTSESLLKRSKTFCREMFGTPAPMLDVPNVTGARIPQPTMSSVFAGYISGVEDALSQSIQSLSGTLLAVTPCSTTRLSKSICQSLWRHCTR